MPLYWSIFDAGGPFRRLVGFAGDPGMCGGFASPVTKSEQFQRLCRLSISAPAPSLAAICAADSLATRHLCRAASADMIFRDRLNAAA
jgi:hypothetical protein